MQRLNVKLGMYKSPDRSAFYNTQLLNKQTANPESLGSKCKVLSYFVFSHKN